MYSGYCHVSFPFTYGAFTLSGRLSQNRSVRSAESILQSEPHGARAMVWALPRSLAATYGIDVSFSSSGYLDVSVHRVPLHALWIGAWIHAVPACGFPHSEIRGSKDICSSPRLFAACRVFLRLPVPRHPPRALSCLASLPSCRIALQQLGLSFLLVASFIALFISFSLSVSSGYSVFGFQGTSAALFAADGLKRAFPPQRMLSYG